MPYNKYVERYLKKVREEVSEPNRQLILDFAAQCRAEKHNLSIYDSKSYNLS